MHIKIVEIEKPKIDFMNFHGFFQKLKIFNKKLVSQIFGEQVKLLNLKISVNFNQK